MQQAKIYRIGKRTPKQTGVITIASVLQADETGNYIEYNASFCSPNDNYDKQFGIGLARERLADDVKSVGVPQRKHNVVIQQILTNMLDIGMAPDWARKTIQDHLDSMQNHYQTVGMSHNISIADLISYIYAEQANVSSIEIKFQHD